MQRSGGSAPAGVDAAACQQPHRRGGGGGGGDDAAPQPPLLRRPSDRAHPYRPAVRRVASTTWAETVRRGGGQSVRRRLLLRRLGSRPPAPGAAQQRFGDRDSRKLASPAAEAVAEGEQLGVQRVDRLRLADRLAEVHAATGRQRLDLTAACRRASTIGAIVSSSISVRSA